MALTHSRLTARLLRVKTHTTSHTSIRHRQPNSNKNEDVIMRQWNSCGAGAAGGGAAGGTGSEGGDGGHAGGHICSGVEDASPDICTQFARRAIEGYRPLANSMEAHARERARTWGRMRCDERSRKQGALAGLR